MPARPWYPKFPADYAVDTKSLTFEQHGLYNLLLDELWLRGGLPDDPRDIAELIGKDPRSTSRVYEGIKHFFHRNNGVITHKKLEKLRKDANKVSKARQDAARRRWEKEHPDETMPKDAE